MKFSYQCAAFDSPISTLGNEFEVSIICDIQCDFGSLGYNYIIEGIRFYKRDTPHIQSFIHAENIEGAFEVSEQELVDFIEPIHKAENMKQIDSAYDYDYQDKVEMA